MCFAIACHTHSHTHTTSTCTCTTMKVNKERKRLALALPSFPLRQDYSTVNALGKHVFLRLRANGVNTLLLLLLLLLLHCEDASCICSCGTLSWEQIISVRKEQEAASMVRSCCGQVLAAVPAFVFLQKRQETDRGFFPVSRLLGLVCPGHT